MTASAAPRVRRSQSERSAQTRAKVIEAAMACVTDLGFRGATMTAIAQRAGVTWGAMQHQFGDKDAILDAVLVHSLEAFERDLAAVGNTAPEVAVRVHAFCKTSGQLLRGHSYRAFFEIQLNRGREPGRPAASDWGQQVAGVLTRTWGQAFDGLDLPAAALAEARRFSFMVLAGIASEALLFPGADQSKPHLRTLEATLMRLLDDSRRS